MKKIFISFLVIVTIQLVNAQNVGIGTSTPLARLHVLDSNVVFSATGSGPFVFGNPPVSGQGRRMMWYADKAAFRAGYVNSTNWDKDNIGQYSVALGYNTTASGYYSNAMGYNTTALGENSTAMGAQTTASGNSSTAMGINTTASGHYSTAMGSGSQANTTYSVAIGESITANSWNSISLGRWNDPINITPTSSWVLTEPLLIVGNGTGPSDKKNALVILKNGNIGINTSTPTAPLTFSQDLQKKIILFTGPLGDAGFSTSPGQIRIHADDPNTNLVFGYDNRTTGFVENMRIYGSNGNMLVRGSVTANSSFYTSDIRYKKNLQPINNALQRITQLQGYNYYWKDKEQDTSLKSGIIAQEVQKIFPELVHADDKGYLSVNYVGLIPYLIQSTKEQQVQINNQSTEIRQQQDQINKLSKENEEMKKLKMEVEELMKMVDKLK